MLDVYLYGSGECDQFGPIEDVYESKIPRKIIGLNTLPTNKVYKICCGAQHTLVLTTSGQIYSWGSNDEKALGRDGLNTALQVIDKIPFPMNNIAAGDCHSVAYNTDLNLLYVWGSYRNISGLIADPKEFPELMDMKLFNNNKLVKVVCGNNHTVVLAGESVYAWGNSESGQTGINPKSKKKKKEFIPMKFASKHVVDIFSGSNHSFLISDKDGKRTLKAWGLNNWGQLGLGDRKNFWYPMVIDYFEENNIEIKSVTGGEYHTLFLTKDSQLYTCGKNDEGQCGVELPLKEIPAVNSNQAVQVEHTDAIINTTNEEKKENPKDALHLENSNEEQDNVAENESRDNLQATNDVNQDEWVFTTPIKVEFFNKENIKISNIYSSMGFNYALDVKDNQAYSWGDGNNYKLGNKKENEVKLPFTIPKVFFFNLKLDHFSLGSQHVSVALTDPSSNIPKPQLDFDLVPYLEQLKLKVGENITKSGKRRREVSADEELGAEGETGKRRRTRFETAPSDRVLRSVVKKNDTKREASSKSKSNEKSKEKIAKKSETKEKKVKAKSKGNEKLLSKTKSSKSKKSKK